MHKFTETIGTQHKGLKVPIIVIIIIEKNLILYVPWKAKPSVHIWIRRVSKGFFFFDLFKI